MKKNLIAPLMILAAVMSGSMAFAGPYSFDSSHSDLEFKVKHLVVATVKGRFDKWSGTFNYDEKTGKVTDLKIEVETASVNTNEPDRDKHLRSDDFFKASKFPKATFEAKDFKIKKGSEVTVDGNLTMVGVTKPTKLRVTFTGEATDPWGNAKLAFEGSGKLKRSDFGMTWNKTLDKGGVLVSDEVQLEIEAQASKKAEDKK